MSDAPPLLTTREVARLLRATTTMLAAELAAVPARLLTWHPAPGEWCINEVLGHLIEAEQRGFAGRIRILVADRDPQLQTWDQNEVAARRRDCERDGAKLLAELVALRQDGVRLVDGLREADLGRGGHHPTVGYVRIGELLNEWVHHDRNHVRQILANAQAFVWPQMGATQRFSEP